MQLLGPKGVWSRVRQPAFMVNTMKTSRLERDQELALTPHTGKALVFFLPTCALNFEDSLPSELQMFFSEETSTGGVSVAVLEN